MLYRIQSTPGSVLRLKYQIIWLTCRKTNPFSETLQSYCPFHFNRFLWNVRVDRICNPYYLLSVGAIKIIWFYQKLFIPSSFSTSVFETHNPFSLVFLLVFIMFYSICHVTFTLIKRFFDVSKNSKLLAGNSDKADSKIYVFTALLTF